MIKKRDIIFLLLLILSYSLVCFSQINRSLYQDEPFSIKVFTAPTKEAMNIIHHDVHPPGYYIVQKTWNIVIGKTIPLMRLLNILIGVICILIFFKISKNLILTALFALNPYFIFYSNVLRVYIMLMILTLLSIHYYKKYIDENNSKYFKISLLFATISVYFHYYMFFYVGGLILHSLIFNKEKVKNYLLSVVLLSPVLLYAFYQSRLEIAITAQDAYKANFIACLLQLNKLMFELLTGLMDVDIFRLKGSLLFLGVIVLFCLNFFVINLSIKKVKSNPFFMIFLVQSLALMFLVFVKVLSPYGIASRYYFYLIPLILLLFNDFFRGVSHEKEK